ncbi:MAG: hypothetical protein AB8B86_06430 [Pseudomonadales bacterium]
MSHSIANRTDTTEQIAEQGAALLQRKSGQQRASAAQFYAAMFMLLLACGLAFGAIADQSVNRGVEKSVEETKPALVKSSRFCIFGVDDLKLRPSAARGVDEKRSPAYLENGDCWMDKPGQMA